MNNNEIVPGRGVHPVAHCAVRAQCTSYVLRMAGAIACIFVIGCGEFHMSASELTVGPSPAVPGDTVVASFFLSLLPIQSHTVIVIIDGEEHMRVTSSEAPAIPVTLELGDAADLISEYGTGEHDVYVMVHAGDEATGTQSVVLQLNASPPEEGL